MYFGVAYGEKYLQDFNMQGETCLWGLFKCTWFARAVSVPVTGLTVNTAVGRNPSGVFVGFILLSCRILILFLWSLSSAVVNSATSEQAADHQTEEATERFQVLSMLAGYMDNKALPVCCLKLLVTRCAPALFGCIVQLRPQPSGKAFKFIVILSPSPVTMTWGCILFTALDAEEIQAGLCKKHLYGFPK